MMTKKKSGHRIEKGTIQTAIYPFIGPDGGPGENEDRGYEWRVSRRADTLGEGVREKKVCRSFGHSSILKGGPVSVKTYV